MADIESVVDGKWSAKAAAGDALERVPHEAEFVAIWVHDGKLSWSKTDCSGQGMALLASALAEMSARFIRMQLDEGAGRIVRLDG